MEVRLTASGTTLNSRCSITAIPATEGGRREEGREGGRRERREGGRKKGEREEEGREEREGGRRERGRRSNKVRKATDICNCVIGV